MEFFEKAKSVRLRNGHGKFLRASKDQLSVVQDREGTGEDSVWEVEVLKKGGKVLRLKSCYNCYLRAMSAAFILGATGKKVQQGRPYKLDRSVEWEPVKDGENGVKLKSYVGTYLRSNHGVPPWRNSVTHDVPLTLRELVLWEVQVVENVPVVNTSFQGLYNKVPSPRAVRLVYYTLCDDTGQPIDHGDDVWPQLNFKGNSMGELALKVKQEIESKDEVILCAKDSAGSLYPQRPALPPQNAPMHVFVVKASSPAGKKLLALEEDTENDEAVNQENEGRGEDHEYYSNEDGAESVLSDSLESRQEGYTSSRHSSASSGPLVMGSGDFSGR